MFESIWELLKYKSDTNQSQQLSEASTKSKQQEESVTDLSEEEKKAKIEALKAIDPNEGTDEEFFKKVDAIIGERFDIPMTPVTDPGYNKLYLSIAMTKYTNPVLFRKILNWE